MMRVISLLLFLLGFHSNCRHYQTRKEVLCSVQCFVERFKGRNSVFIAAIKAKTFDRVHHVKLLLVNYVIFNVCTPLLFF